MSLAKAVGLKVSAVERFEVGDKVCILIQRYDRTAATDGTVTRIHQEDFCQALGFPPEHKYQQEGGPLLRDCVALLREWSTAPVLDIRDFIDGQIFNVLVGNADAHGKNYSMLYQDGQRRLAPFYDLVCTLAWPELSKTPAMKIGGSPSLDVFTAAPWQKMAQESRLGWPMIRERIEALCTKATDALRGSALCEVMTGQMEERVAAFAQERASNFLSSRPFSRDIGSWKLLC
ncbi:MAG: HipA domain-containing protein [Kiritimatiellia bacterium]|jgi:serine/threonine-protein kinase HipA|nr:HipA domain-containing protein [Kiritimatiellia bacterium]NLC82253.1 type II toxin-antitoxin system HipA family toxin [Lentisphaerota bacterium]